MIPEDDIPSVLLDLRIRYGLTQAEMARLIGPTTAVSSISAWERGERVPSRINNARIMRAFPELEEDYGYHPD